MALILTDDQAITLADWLREDPLFYQKGLAEFCDTEKKARKWEDQAKDMNVTDQLTGKPATVRRLRIWYESALTKIGKLTLTKSGQGTSEETATTDRDRFLLRHFAFFKEHITRQIRGSRLAVSVSFIPSIYLVTIGNDCHSYAANSVPVGASRRLHVILNNRANNKYCLR